jgi:hypothetical protein
MRGWIRFMPLLNVVVVHLKTPVGDLMLIRLRLDKLMDVWFVGSEGNKSR